MEYEQFTDRDGVIHERAKVPGGWFVRIYNQLPFMDGDQHDDFTHYGSYSFTAFFYPDSNHTWELPKEASNE